MAVIDDIREQQKKAMHELDAKGKLAYFWYYYKVHTIVFLFVGILVGTFIYQYVTSKEYGFYASFVNAAVTDYSVERGWAEEFAQYAQIDTDEYEVYIDTSLQLSDDIYSQYALAGQEKMMAMLQASEINAIIADTEPFESYAQNECFYDLESVLAEEDIENYKDYFYYTDAALFDSEDDDAFTEEEQQTYYEKTIDHYDPDAMEKPVAVGIRISNADKIKAAGYYNYLTQNNVTFQGNPSEVLLGIPITTKDPQLAVRFLEYLGAGSDTAGAN